MNWRKISWHLFLALLALFLCLHAYLARYSHPMADDLKYAQKDISTGLLNASIWEYQNWNGRFASNVLVLLNPIRWGFDALDIYRFVPCVLFALTLASCFLFLGTMPRPKPLHGWALAGAIVWTALYAHGMPDIGEGFYWYTGSVTYQFASVLVLIGAAMVVTAVRGQRWWLIYAAIPILVFAQGCNEVIMELLVVAGLLVIIRSFKHKYAIRLPPWILLTTLGIGAAIMILAPGNEGRGAHFPLQHKLLHSLWMSGLQTVRFAATWILSGSLVLFSSLWIIHHDRLAERIPLIAHGFGIKPWMTFSLLLGLIFLCVFPAYWSTGILGQHRTVNVAYFFFLPLWFLNLSALIRHFPSLRLNWREPARSRITIVLLLLVIIDFGSTGNSANALFDFHLGRAERSDIQLQARYALLNAAARTEDRIAEVPLIVDPPKSLYVLDLRKPDFLVNTDYAAWFGLNEVRIDSSAQSFPAKAIN